MNLEPDNNFEKEFLLARNAEIASYVNEKGLIKFSQANEPRIDHSPNPEHIDAEGKHKCLGFLVECSSTNELIYSTDLTNDCWFDVHKIARIPENEVLHPEGKSGGNKVISIIDLPGNDFHLIKQLIAHNNQKEKTVSIFVKKVENGGSKDFTIWAVNGVQIAVFSRKDWSFISGIADSTNVEYYPHGWVRLSAIYSVDKNDIYFGTSDGSKSVYHGENKKQFYLFAPQLEYLSTVTSYIPTKNQSRFRGNEIVYFDDSLYWGNFQVVKQHIEKNSIDSEKISCLNNIFNNIAGNQKSLEIYDEVGKLVECLVEKNFKSRSLFYYKLIIYSLQQNSENLIKLGIILLKQGWVAGFIDKYNILTNNDNKPEDYQNLAISLSEQGAMAEAVEFWQEFNQKLPSQEKLFEKIWKGLNGIDPIKVDEYEAEISYEAQNVRNYFKNTSKYTIINLEQITDSDRQILNDADLSLTNLKLIQQDNINLENIYINSFREKSNFKLSELVKKRKDFEWPPLNHTRDFQQSIVETGYIYTVCPVTGNILKSNQSFAINYSTFFYRFVGWEIFYLIVGQWDNFKLGIYFPRYELVVNIANDLWKHRYNFSTVINEFKTQAVINNNLFPRYISSQKIKPVVAFVGCINNLGHYLWQELGGLEYLHEAGILDRVDKFLIAPSNRLKVNDIFPEIPAEKFIFPEHETPFKLILKNNYFVLRVSEHYIRKGLESRMNSAVTKSCSPSFLKKVEESRQSFPLLWINMREHNKCWVNQIDGYAKIITSLSDKYAQIGVIFDGMSDTRNIMEQIKSAIPDTVKTYNALECTIDETIAWAYAIDCYIAVVGSGLTFLTWFANKPGVAHGNKGHLGQKIFWTDVREDLIEPIFISEIPFSRNNPKYSLYKQNQVISLYKNYNCDWKVMYKEIIKIVEMIEKKKTVSTKYNPK